MLLPKRLCPHTDGGLARICNWTMDAGCRSPDLPRNASAASHRIAAAPIVESYGATISNPAQPHKREPEKGAIIGRSVQAPFTVPTANKGRDHSTHLQHSILHHTAS